MKNFLNLSITVMAFSFLATGATAQAAESDKDYKDYEKSARAATGPTLGYELTKRMGTASWYCGSELAQKVYKNVANGKASMIYSSASPNCKREANYMVIALDESIARTLRPAADAAEKVAKKIENGAEHVVSKHFGKSKAPETTTFAQLYIGIGQIKNDLSIETTGSGFCLEHATEIFQKWAKTEVIMDGDSEKLQSDKTLTCSLQRLGQEKFGMFSCDNWFNSSLYNFETQDILMTTTPRLNMTEAEQKELQSLKEQPGASDKKQSELDRLTAALNFGTAFTGVISILPSKARATFEIRGVSRRAQLEAMRKNATAGTFEQPFECSVKTSLNVRVTGPVTTGTGRKFR